VVSIGGASGTWAARARRPTRRSCPPNWQVYDSFHVQVESDDFYAKEDPEVFHGPRLVRLHDCGLLVVPCTINDEATMQRLIDLGGDGIISDDVDLLIEVARRNGL
jgi:glycerophosphoryl diester phosphodiesterase